NPPATQVEMGNVGRHYFNWRYRDLHPATFDTAYDVHVTVGGAPTRATGVEESVSITNSTGQPLKSVVMRAAWRHWEGVFALRAASVGGVEAQTRWRQEINLEVSLPVPLRPGERATVSLRFDLKPRRVGGRTGCDRADD